MKLSCSRIIRQQGLIKHRTGWWLSVLLVGMAGSVLAADSGFLLDIRADSLPKALQQLADQLGMQLVYDARQVNSEQRPPLLTGKFSTDEALQRLLANTGLRWRVINATTLAIYHPVPNEVSAPSIAASGGATVVLEKRNATRNADDLAVMPDLLVHASEISQSRTNSRVMGFEMPLLETPRSVSVVSDQEIDINNISAVEDLLRVVPGVFTTTRFGVQGSVDIRGVPADTYFRGIKRLTLQGHGRSVLAAMDSIEVVAGPASPLYGPGKIGGYTNFDPVSGRARTGEYLTEPQGFVRYGTGSYDRHEISAGHGGPASSLHRGLKGGYYLYGLLEDSKSFAEGVPVRQGMLQAATSMDDMVGSMRLETGLNYQVSRTSGALIGRLTQDLVDNGLYIGGSPLVNLDLNDSGAIGYLEMNQASPVTGTLSSFNQPLSQVFAWPTDANGEPLAAAQFPKIAGIPAAMYSYLQAHPESDPGGWLRAQGIGGPVPISGQVPVGMVLSPATVSMGTFNTRRSTAFERDINARFFTAYADLINDDDPLHTVKNQLLMDYMDQYKSSNQPYSQEQRVLVVEDKLTMTRQLQMAPHWLHANLLLTANLRDTVSSGRNTFGDYGNHRTDAMGESWNSSDAGMFANTTFVSANDNSDLSSDGLPWQNIYRTHYWEVGVGAMLDVSLPSRTRLVAGTRVDGSRASNVNRAGRFNFNTGTSANPGAYYVTDEQVSNWDRGSSWSVSVSQDAGYGLHPYLTASRATVMLDGNNNALLNQVIASGHIGYSTLREAGVKGEWLSGRVNVSVAAFKQGRDEVSETDDTAVLSAYVTATTSRGWQSQWQWRATNRLLLSMTTLRHITRYTPNIGGLIQVDARFLGFQDVLDAGGNVVYPAEAFLYGGRARILLPDGMKQYEIKQGNPQKQASLSAQYDFNKRWQAQIRSKYLSSTCSGRLCLVRLPQSLVFDAGLRWNRNGLSLHLDVTNLTNETYYRARTGELLGDVIAQAMPGRAWQLNAKYSF